MTTVEGTVEPGFEAVREAFEANFERHGEVGAAFSLYHRGRQVVDLWGGVADETTGRTWDEGTLQLVFSTTKGATAVCALLLAQRGELDLDAPVSAYWPEFKEAGKADVPVRWLLSHRVGLPTVDVKLSPAEAMAWEPVVEALASQRPYWEPGSAHGYHALTYGWLVGEVVRRISGRSLGTFFAEQVAAPLGLDFWIGLPADQEDRVSRLIEMNIGGGQLPEGFDIDQLPEEARALVRAFTDPDSLSLRALMLTDPPISWNSREAHAGEAPAANGICTARSLARMYASLVGDVDGVRLLGPGTVASATTTQSEGPDRVLIQPTRFGLGFMLNSQFSPLLAEGSFGHAGAGGSLGFADPAAEVGFGYVMNKMQQNLAGDPRTVGLVDAVRRSIA
ncbi:MAG TPA: serine hydrolase domain-containing protein [Acidimicrobiales bacterium]|nr:serine hydrolase domain-containing protein [Acidimicrobiales bacterium]